MLWVCGGYTVVLGAEDAADAVLSQGSYRGWKSRCLANDLVEMHVVPELGGRVMQFKLGGKEFCG